MKQSHPPRAHDVAVNLWHCLSALVTIGVLVLLPSLFLPACGGEEPASGEPPSGELAADRTPQPEPAAAEPTSPKRSADDIMDPSSFEGRERDGVALAAADNLRPELTRALPPGFPDDIPLGNWLSISSVRRLGENDFVLSCSTSYRRDAVGEFFVRQMPEKGWKLVNRSRKPILSVLTFRKDERAVNVMVKKQVMNGDVAFDISYKEN